MQRSNSSRATSCPASQPWTITVRNARLEREHPACPATNRSGFACGLARCSDVGGNYAATRRGKQDVCPPVMLCKSAKSAKYFISRKIRIIRQSPHFGISFMEFWRYVEIMYQNRTRQTPISRNLQSYVRQAVIAYEERMAFVESVCAALNESRFGIGRVSWRCQTQRPPGSRTSGLFRAVG